jgi:hypothetical protein
MGTDMKPRKYAKNSKWNGRPKPNKRIDLKAALDFMRTGEVVKTHDAPDLFRTDTKTS